MVTKQRGSYELKPLPEQDLWRLAFRERLARLRKARGLTQHVLADQVGVHVLQIRRYEGGSSQPTLEVIRRLAQALRVSADELIFDETERGPDEALRYQFEAISRMPAKEQEVVRELLEAVIVKNQLTGHPQRAIRPTTKRQLPRSTAI